MKTTKPELYGEVHDATRCCVEGFGCYVASVCDARGRLLFHEGAGKFDEVREVPSRLEGITWLLREAKQRGQRLMLRPPERMAGTYMPIKSKADIARYLSYYRLGVA